MAQPRVKYIFWVLPETKRLVRKIAGTTEEQKGELMDRQVRQEVAHLG
jgi:hypothetical protein